MGLPANGRRRTPGLRREEVAQLAGVGLSWYTWLEHGRDVTPSASVLDAMARLYDISPAEHAHLFHAGALPRLMLSRFRAEHARRYDDPSLRELIEALLQASASSARCGAATRSPTPSWGPR